jgi:hypothetical protein
MKTNEEILKSLKMCSQYQNHQKHWDCRMCPYYISENCAKDRTEDLITLLNSIDTMKEVCDEMYEEGMKDAWSMAEKITFIDKYGAFTCKEFNEIFDGKNKAEVFEMTPMAVKRKIDEWFKTGNFHVGDVVKYNDVLDIRNNPDEKGVVTKLENGKAYVLWNDQTSGRYPIDELILTGKHVELGNIFNALND